MDSRESFEKLSTVQLTCSEGALFPIHGNEERAINWTPQGGSAQQRGEGGKEEAKQYNAANQAEQFLPHKRRQVQKLLDI